MKDFYWQGTFLDQGQLAAYFKQMDRWIEKALAHPIRANHVITACSSLSSDLLTETKSYEVIKEYLCTVVGCSQKEAQGIIQEIGKEITQETLLAKLSRELGGVDQQELARPSFTDSMFESWAPLGVLMHVTPSNAVGVAPLSVIEGLLAGNMNLVKLSSQDSCFTQVFLDQLCQHDETGLIQNHIIALRFSSKETSWLESMYQSADGIAVWGSEETVKSVKAQAPSQARIIEWGHKISFAYIGHQYFSCEKTIESVAKEICLYDQQACSSPQIIYLDTDEKEDLIEFANHLAKSMKSASKIYPAATLSIQEQAEVTNTVQVANLEQALGLTHVIEADDHQWHILVDFQSGLKASPLYRNVWIKPLPKNKIITALRPMRHYLQTVGLQCHTQDLVEFSDALFRVGVLRICELGRMTESYAGEPHDGVYALQRYSRRISLNLGQTIEGFSSLEELRKKEERVADGSSIMCKEDFQKQVIDDAYADLYFKSGGSSGAAKLSVFTYRDYHTQMKLAARGLYAAGLNPNQDRCMNLFFAGDLYGGFLSFYTILEYLNVVQFPMAASQDFSGVADVIIDQRVNVLLGMPTYIFQLLESQKEKLIGHHCIEKIYYGGEHFNAGQMKLIKDVYGIKLIKSATYGSVDAGPLGYQCEYCEGSVHHLHSGLQSMEIVDLYEDRPVGKGQVGRLLFTSLNRSGQNLKRYDIGDLGRFIEEPCPCGRSNPRFDLVGRHGDVFKMATNFLNYKKFVKILEEIFDYQGQVQLVLLETEGQDHLVCRVQTCIDVTEGELKGALLQAYGDLAEVYRQELMTLTCEIISLEQFQITAKSGKLMHVVDERLKS